MTKRLLMAVVALLCLAAFPFAVLGGTGYSVTIDMPYYHVWITDVPDADDRFIYRWTAEAEGEPMPEGVTENYWDWMLQGNTEGILSLRFVFDAPGTYCYRLAAYVPEPKDGYVYEPRTFLLTVHVQSIKDGELVADWNLLNEASGEKVDRIDLDPSYTKNVDESTQPTDESGENPTQESTKNPTRESTEKPSGSGGSGGSGSSGGGKDTDSGQTQKTGKTVKTGDETRMLSLVAILAVSAMLLIFLVHEESKRI